MLLPSCRAAELPYIIYYLLGRFFYLPKMMRKCALTQQACRSFLLIIFRSAVLKRAPEWIRAAVRFPASCVTRKKNSMVQRDAATTWIMPSGCSKRMDGSESSSHCGSKEFQK